jgi:ATP-dependent helicase Lhr and Lhr-like helicase
VATRKMLAVEAWLAARGQKPFAFQSDVWRAIAHGQSGLLHATTGSGKTYAVWLGVLQIFLSQTQDKEAIGSTPARRRSNAPPLSVLWITPMRALAADTQRALKAPLDDLLPHWTLGTRTGDTTTAERARQNTRWPSALLTTPESLSLMLARADCANELANVRAVVVDEWHELMGNKRGVQLQLALARIKRISPGLMVWGMSATLGNLEPALQALLGPEEADTPESNRIIIQGRTPKKLIIDTLIPDNPGKYSWAGHLGARMVGAVVREIETSGTTLVFANTRSQAEIWYQLMLAARPEWAGDIALHHGSLDKEVRAWVELGLKEGRLRAVVATSSLDLGVDFLPVERVLQIGSAKGVARLVQRAGRSGHAPGRASRITLVPTNTLDLLEAAGARNAAAAKIIEKRDVPAKPHDVLVQHLVTLALGSGFEPAALFTEVKTAWSYRDLTQAEFDWALAFCERGGASLTAYPDYHRIARDATGIYRVPNAAIARRHRMGIGTIVGDGSVQVKFLSGARIGTVEESFIARLKKGDCFVFGGRLLEFIRVHEMSAYVKKAVKNKGMVVNWQGSKMPLSSELAHEVLALMQQAQDGDFSSPEMRAARPMLQMQMQLSSLPVPGTLLVESYWSREGQHLYVFAFAGRYVNMGLASLVAWRLAKVAPATFSIAVNDYGFELLCADAFDISSVIDKSIFDIDDLFADVLASLNSSELARRRFREIARIAGLIFTGYPGAPQSLKSLQASSSLFFDVFQKYDATNLLLNQASNEVLSQELDIARLATTLEKINAGTVSFHELSQPSPLCVPLMVERLREKVSSEQLSARLDRIISGLEQAAPLDRGKKSKV